MGVSRRRFVKLGFVSTLGLLLAPVRRVWAKKKVAVPLDKADKLKQVQGWMVLKIQNKEYLLVRDTETTVKALQAECTHQQCQVKYNPDSHKVDCPCHQSAFTLAGKVQSQPATKDLPSFAAELKGDRIILEID